MADPMSVFQVAGRAMSAQLVRLNTTASNLANAGGTTGSADTAYKTMKPVFRTSFDVEKIVTAGEAPTKIYDPNNPVADKDGNIYQAAVDESREFVDMMETARSYQNNVEVLNTAKQLTIDTLKLGR
jgi:flagellar basal-body rod protein FlgC